MGQSYPMLHPQEQRSRDLTMLLQIKFIMREDFGLLIQIVPLFIC